MALLLLLFLCSLRSAAVESTAHGLLANGGNGSKYSGWHMEKDTTQSPCYFTQSPSVPNSIEQELLEMMNEFELLDIACKENEAHLPIIAIANSSTGFPYSYGRAINAEPSHDDGRNMTSPYPVSHEHIEAMGHDKLIVNHEQAFDEVVGNAQIMTDILNYSDSMHQYTRSSDSTKMIKMVWNLITWILLWITIIYLLCFTRILFTTWYPQDPVAGEIQDYEEVSLSKEIADERSRFSFLTVAILATSLAVITLSMIQTSSFTSIFYVEKLQPGTKDVWWFLMPFTWKLCLVIIAMCLWKGVLVWVFEHLNNPEFEGTLSEQVGEILSFSFSIFVNSQTEKLKSNFSRLVVILWLFGVLVLVQSYTASLSWMLITNGDYVGHQKGSLVFDISNQTGLQEQKLKANSSKENKEKNNFSPSDDDEWFDKDGEYPTKHRSQKAYKKLNFGVPYKYVVHKFLKSNGNLWMMTSFSFVATLPYKVSGEFSLHENHNDDKEYYDELIYELYNKVNGSVSFEDLNCLFVEHSSFTRHIKNGKTNVKLKILVPTENTFHEFVKVDHDPKGNGMIVTGYSIEVFKEVMDSLPYRVSYEFYPYENGHSNDMGYYDDLIQQLHVNRYDGVVGDITITSKRSKYGDFTLPYMMSGVSMIVPVADGCTKSLWWFLNPLNLKLWLLIIALFLSKGILVWIFEHENNPEFRGTFPEQVGKILSFSFSIFVFAQKETLKSNYSRLIVNLWIFGVFLFVTSYASILQSMLTSNNDQPIVTSIEQLITNGDYVGYQKESFVYDLLKQMGFQEQKLKAYSSIEEYEIALSRGSHRNGVSAIIDEIPYVKLFLAKYANRYMMVGPTINPSGFGFLFQRGCAIVHDVSRAVLNFTEGERVHELEKKWFGSQEPNPSPTQMPYRDIRLSTYDFRGVLLITESITGISLLIFIVVAIFRRWQTTRDPSSNGAIVVDNIEEYSNRFYAEMNGNPINEGNHVVVIESHQATQNDNDLVVGATLNECIHSETAYQDKSFTGDEISKMLHSPARSSVDDMGITLAFLGRTQATL
ncbi:hypothetical protein AAC387_Pa04g0656 [Persea americana]